MFLTCQPPSCDRAAAPLSTDLGHDAHVLLQPSALSFVAPNALVDCLVADLERALRTQSLCRLVRAVFLLQELFHVRPLRRIKLLFLALLSPSSGVAVRLLSPVAAVAPRGVSLALSTNRRQRSAQFFGNRAFALPGRPHRAYDVSFFLGE